MNIKPRRLLHASKLRFHGFRTGLDRTSVRLSMMVTIRVLFMREVPSSHHHTLHGLRPSRPQTRSNQLSPNQPKTICKKTDQTTPSRDEQNNSEIWLKQETYGTTKLPETMLTNTCCNGLTLRRWLSTGQVAQRLSVRSSRGYCIMN